MVCTPVFSCYHLPAQKVNLAEISIDFRTKGHDIRVATKYKRLTEKLYEFRQTRDKLKEKFPGVDFELDHPFSKNILNNYFLIIISQNLYTTISKIKRGK